MSGFYQALPFVLSMEGGFVDDPDDQGGATNRGITQSTYDAWRDSMQQPRQSVGEITEGEVQAIYHRDYWLAAQCDLLPWPASAAHFDAAVNHGVERAKKMLQKAVGVTVDGIIGPKTLAAVRSTYDLVGKMAWVRVDFYYRISTGNQLKFLRGWLRRVLHLRREFG